MSTRNQRYREAIEAARQRTGAKPTDEARLAALYARIRDGRASPARRQRAWGWSIALAVASLAAAAPVALWLWRQADAPEPLVATVAMRSGEVVLTDAAGMSLSGEQTTLEEGGRLELRGQGRVELGLGQVAKVVAVGPAKLQLSREGALSLSDGTALFAVEPRPAGQSFAVRAGDALVVVHGTRFALVVADGVLAGAEVSEGLVEIRRPGREPAWLRAGEETGAVAPAEALLPLGRFESPWWHASAPGYLAVSSEPAGATVSVDGSRIGDSPLLAKWPAGGHEILVEGPGLVAERRTVEVAPGAVTRLLVRLERAAQPAAGKRETPAREQDLLWRQAEASLAGKQCERLSRQVAKIVEKSRGEEEKARAEALAAECLLRSGRKRQALAAYEGIAERHAATATAGAALFEAAKLLGELGRREEALGRIERYLAGYPEGGFAEPASFRRCELLIGLERLVDAEGCLERYVASFPAERRAGEALLLLATMARGRQEWTRAAGLYRRHLAAAPDGERSEEARFRLLECLRRGALPGLAEEARDYLRRHPASARAGEVESWLR